MVCSPAFSGEHDARRKDGEVVVDGDAAETARLGGLLCMADSRGVVWLLNLLYVEGLLLWLRNRLFCGKFCLKLLINEETLLMFLVS